jgi:putative hemolysin
MRGTAAGFGRDAKILFFPALRPIRDLHGLPATLGQIGSLEVRLATTKKEVRKAQKLRYRVFFKEGGAIADARAKLTRRDIDPYDRCCDHLIVLDHDFVNRFGRRKAKVVGCYRLLRQDMAEQYGGFYSAQEFDLAPLLARHEGKRFLELGRSCVHPLWRSKKVLELLWRGIWTYVRHHRVDVMFGCASLPGTEIGRHVAALRLLAEARSDQDWCVHALPQRRVPLRLPDDLQDQRRAFASLPPLLKGYLRTGATIGPDAVLDHGFGTTDVFIIMPISKIDPRYISYFSAPGQLAA